MTTSIPKKLPQVIEDPRRNVSLYFRFNHAGDEPKDELSIPR
jgi:hypothetical protein